MTAVAPVAPGLPNETTTGLQFRLRYPDGRSEQLVVDADRALIGSAAHCEVRLPADAAAPEAVEVFSSEKVVHLAARAAQSPPLLDGVPVTSGAWGSGQVLTIGGVALTVAVVDLGQRRRGTSPFWLLAPVPIIAVIATVVYANTVGPGEPQVPDAPALFDAPIATCPQPAGEQLAPFAAEKLRTALSKRERGPFSSADAVAAVPLFEVAAACFKTVGDSEDEREAAGSAATLRKKLEDEYSVRRVRLEHFFRIGDSSGCKREIVSLLPMIAQRNGKYVEWLGFVERFADLDIQQRTTQKLY
jgi:hypothetical protein